MPASEPRVRKDGRCARRGCKTKRTTRLPYKSQIPNIRTLLERDPFCSSVCARLHYGCNVKNPSTS